MAPAKGSEEAKAWAAKMKAAREAKKGERKAAEHPVVSEERDKMAKRAAIMKANRAKKAERKEEGEKEAREIVASVRDARNAMVKAAKEGHLMAPAKKAEVSFASPEIKEVEEHPLKKAIRKHKEKKAKEAVADKIDAVKEEVKVEPEISVKVMSKREKAKHDKKMEELKKKLVEASPAGKAAAVASADEKKAATKEKRLAALARAREAKKAKKEASKPKEEKKEEAPASKPEAEKKEMPKEEKVNLAAIRKDVKELRKKFCPPVAKMRKPELLHEIKRLRVKEGLAAEDEDLESLDMPSIRKQVQMLRKKHCPAVAKMRKPALLAELKELKERGANVEKSDYSMTSKEMKDAKRKEEVARKKKRIADRAQAKKMEKEGTMRELGGRD